MKWPRRRVKIVEKVRYTTSPLDKHYHEFYTRFLAAIESEVSEHTPYTNGRMIDGRYGDDWWCAVCRSPWPCRFISWALAATKSEQSITGLSVVLSCEQETP